MQGIPEASIFDSLRSHIGRLLKVEEDHKFDIYTQTFQAAEIADLNYWLQLLLAAGIATLGLVQNSVAVIIGAMLVSPLIGPIMAAGLALALGDFLLGVRALLNLLASVAGAVLFASMVVRALPFRSPTPEILARTQPNLLDLAVALLAGLAGSIVACRGGHSGGITALPGVAIAVALMPPLCVAGFGFGVGLDWNVISGGSLLFVTNLVAIVSASFLVFFVVRIDAPAARGQIADWLEQNEHNHFLWALFHRPGARKLLDKAGSLPRRALIVMVFLTALYVPLRNGLEKVREETLIRSVIQSEIRRVFAPDRVVSQHVDLGPPIRIQIVSTEPLPKHIEAEMRTQIAVRTHREVELSVLEVAQRRDVLALAQRLASAPASIPDLEATRREALAIIERAIANAWPSESLPLLDYSLHLSTTGLSLHLAYLATVNLDAPGEEAIQKAFQAATHFQLPCVFERVDPHVDLFSWRAGMKKPPAEATPAIGRLAELLRTWPAASCRILLPSRSGPQLAAGVVKEIEVHGVSGSRCKIEFSNPQHRAYALLERPGS
jgi:uncharacterized hydrophobic protein (TIGR00271 family)